MCTALLGLVLASRAAEERVPVWEEASEPVNAAMLGLIMLTLAGKRKVDRGTWPLSFLFLSVVALGVAAWMVLN